MPTKIAICEECGMALPADDLDAIDEHMNRHAEAGEQAFDVLQEVLTVEEVATLYDLDDGGVRATILRGSIPARKSGRTWLIRRQDAENQWKNTTRKRPGRKPAD